MAFVLAITGVLPGWLSVAVLAGFGLLAAAWVVLIFCPPLFRGFIEIWR